MIVNDSNTNAAFLYFWDISQIFKNIIQYQKMQNTPINVIKSMVEEEYLIRCDKLEKSFSKKIPHSNIYQTSAHLHNYLAWQDKLDAVYHQALTTV